MATVLDELAKAHGVATRYEDWHQRKVRVDRDIVVAVLGLLGVDATSPKTMRAELRAIRARAERPPPTLVVRQDQRPPRVPDGELRAEDGGVREVAGRLPDDLAPGWYRLTHGTGHTTVIVTPERLALPPRTWGWMLQLYALRSERSWGAGDFADLTRFATWAAGPGGAGALLLNPLHAVVPVHPVPASPYSPSSRRFINPLYLHIEDIDAYRTADPTVRSTVDSLRPPAGTDLIDYEAVWTAKRQALELLWGHQKQHHDADDFATYCALAEKYGADWRTWPTDLRRPDHPAVARERTGLADRVAFHAWLQHLCDKQLGAAARAAAGMSVGIVHDIAVGVDPAGADGWMLQDVLAEGVRVGAPPDAFNQLGQDWGLAAWRPDRLAATGYRAYRDLLTSTLRHGGGLRVDHVAGLWRLWWIPPGASADQGTYVHYDAAAMLGALIVEAHQVGAVVVGEDLGTVPPKITRTLRERNVLGSAVLWFTRDYRNPKAPFRPPADYPELALASITTHDLPTAPGFLTGEHVRVRAELGILGQSVAAEQAQAEADLAALRELLAAQGLSDEDPIVALHELLARTPCRLVMASPYDVLGEIRQPNLPGTVEEYPNWRIPLPVSLDDMIADPRMAAIAKLLDRRETSGRQAAPARDGDTASKRQDAEEDSAETDTPAIHEHEGVSPVGQVGDAGHGE